MKMSLIVLAALAVTMMLRKRSAALRHWVLAAGVACAAASPILTTIVPAWTLPLGTPAPFTAFDEAASAGTPGVAHQARDSGRGRFAHSLLDRLPWLPARLSMRATCCRSSGLAASPSA